MSGWSSDTWQKIGIVFAIVFGLWGAGLSSFQEYRAYKKGVPKIYSQLSLARPDFKEGAKSRPATFVVTAQNSGQASITFLPTVSVVVSNPGSGLSKALSGQLASKVSYGLPKTLKAGEEIAATIVTEDSDSVFGPNMSYVIILQTVEGQIYFAENVVGPIKDAEAYEVLLKNAKYQAKVEFESRPAIMLQSKP